MMVGGRVFLISQSPYDPLDTGTPHLLELMQITATRSRIQKVALPLALRRFYIVPRSYPSPLVKKVIFTRIIRDQPVAFVG